MKEIRSLQNWELLPWLKDVHYAKRVPSISFAYGLFVDGVLVGVVTYGTPSSSTLRAGVAGIENADKVIELNRLCFVQKLKNAASYLVSNSIKLLPKPCIVVSYADKEVGHIGYVYQACNFIYTGLSAKRTDWKIKGMEQMHGQTIADMSRGQENRAQFMREKFGDDFYLKDRSRKHRYIFVSANKATKKQLENAILYKTEPYPKGETMNYLIDKSPALQGLLI